MQFGTIIADPPWPYIVPGKFHVNAKGYMKYQGMSVEEICLLPVKEISSSESILFLWATGPFIADACQVMNAWGFKHVTALTWHKLTAKGHAWYGAGSWFRGSDEYVLMGRRAGVRCIRTHLRNSFESKAMPHSVKPDYLHELAEGKLREGVEFPAPRLELFARRGRLGWATVGNEDTGQVPLTRCEDIRDSIKWLASDDCNLNLSLSHGQSAM